MNVPPSPHNSPLPRRAFTQALALSFASVTTSAFAAQTVTVRNAQLIVMKELRTHAELTEFHKYLGSRRPTSQNTDQVSDWAFTLDVVSGGSAQRWLYQSNGMLARVDSQVQPVFLIQKPAQFNTLIGAPRY